MKKRKPIYYCWILPLLTAAAFSACPFPGWAQGISFPRDLSPAEGLLTPREKPYREELCLNGRWQFQPVPIPAGWVKNTGVAPELPLADPQRWEATPIKIPSPWNVNEWGGGSKVGEGTNMPYAPSSVYYPSYPSSWGAVRMGWLRRSFRVPATWKNKRLLLHFEAVAGDCRVMVNGREVATNFDAYLPFEADITDVVKEGADNELLVGIRHRKLFDKTNSLYKYFSATYPPGSNTHDLVGIWQDVFLEAIPAVSVQQVFVQPAVASDELVIQVQLENKTNKAVALSVSGDINEWLNRAGQSMTTAAEIQWASGKKALQLPAAAIQLQAGETKTVSLRTTVQQRLKLWSPSAPHLYTATLNITANGKVIDRKTQRFGWRSFTIKDKNIYLNGERIQCFGDLQHPFGPYICSRRFAWAWYKMIKDAGGNAVRPHAQPWPRVYYDLADEMGLVVLDEGALFGSSVCLNLEEPILWQRAAEHVDRLVLRDRNHPSVMGWSIGNEMFAIALLNKPTAEVAARWDKQIVALAKRPLALDPTRDFITADGDKDMDGNMPVWSKHFGHGMRLDQLPDLNKPMVVGESGATYYGKPHELFPFIGVKAYGSYAQRSEALAIDVYQNIVQMARPLLAYYSPSELCWFGIAHMNLGYHDSTRLPNVHDGIFAGKPYEEGKPGYQFERIPPYVTTFNPDLDPALPLYKPLPMFEAVKAALATGKPAPSPWDHYQDTAIQLRAPPPAIYKTAYLAGNRKGRMAQWMDSIGIPVTADGAAAQWIAIDGQEVTEADMRNAQPVIDRIRKEGGLIWILVADQPPVAALQPLLPGAIQWQKAAATSLQSNPANTIGQYFTLRDLYFSELDGDRKVLKQAMTGPLPAQAAVVLEAAHTDWSLFNGVGENKKCAQIVLYEYLQKPQRIGMLTYPAGKGMIGVSSIDYTIINKETIAFWRRLCAAMGISYDATAAGRENLQKKKHDLLLDGPVNN